MTPKPPPATTGNGSRPAEQEPLPGTDEIRQPANEPTDSDDNPLPAEPLGSPVEAFGSVDPATLPLDEATATAPAEPGQDVAALARRSRWRDPATRERAQAQRLRRMQIAYDLYTESNLKMAVIGERLGVPASRISTWVREIERRSVNEMRDRIYNLKARQTAHLEALYRELYTQYLRTRDRRRRKVKTERGIKPEGRVDIRTVEHEDAIGDPKYLVEMRQVLADIRKVWGLDAPIKVASTTPEGEAVALAQASLHDKLGALAEMLKGRAAPPEDDPMLAPAEPPRTH